MRYPSPPRVRNHVREWLTCAAVVTLSAAGCANPHDAKFHDRAVDDPLTRLRNGNERFVRGEADHPHTDPALRRALADSGQHPYAIIVSCSDSRVPVELIFDAGIGDLFVVRVAGNVCAVDETGTIEYAVEHLKVPLVVILGHSGCGAVTAACQHAREKGNLSQLIAHLQPAVERAEAQAKVKGLSPSELVSLAIRENVIVDMEILNARSESQHEGAAHKKPRIVGAIYDIGTGRVEWLDSGETRTAANLNQAANSPARR